MTTLTLERIRDSLLAESANKSQSKANREWFKLLSDSIGARLTPRVVPGEAKMTFMTAADRFQLFHDVLDEKLILSDDETHNFPRHHVQMMRDAFAEALALPGANAPTSPVLPKLIGWRTADYLRETADPNMDRNWSTHEQIVPIFEGDTHTKLGPSRGNDA